MFNFYTKEKKEQKKEKITDGGEGERGLNQLNITDVGGLNQQKLCWRTCLVLKKLIKKKMTMPV